MLSFCTRSAKRCGRGHNAMPVPGGEGAASAMPPPGGGGGPDLRVWWKGLLPQNCPTIFRKWLRKLYCLCTKSSLARGTPSVFGYASASSPIRWSLPCEGHRSQRMLASSLRNLFRLHHGGAVRFPPVPDCALRIALDKPPLLCYNLPVKTSKEIMLCLTVLSLILT